MPTSNDEIDQVMARQSVYSGDEARVTIKGYKPTPTPVPFCTPVEGVHFDGHPQIVKQAVPVPTYAVRREKDLPVTMRDGVRLAVDVYRPDV